MADSCVSQVPVFAGLAAPDQERVGQAARPMRLGKDELAHSPGADARLLVVHTGRVKITRLSADGSEQLIRVLGPGDFTGETAVLSGRSPDDYAAGLEDSTLCVFHHADVADLIREYPDIGLKMLAAVSARLSATEHRLNALTTRGVESRLATYLLGLSAADPGHPSEITLPLAKKDVASLLDTTPESFSRALKALAGRGVISTGPGRTVAILQRDRLGMIATQE